MNFRTIKDTFSKNGPSIATAASIILTGLSVIFAIKKSRENMQIMSDYEDDKIDLETKPLADQKPTDEMELKLKYATKFVVTNKEALACAGGSMLCAYLSNKWNGRTIAGLSAALMLNEDKLKKVYKRAEDVFGKGGAEDLKTAVNTDIPFDPDNVDRARVRHRREEPAVFFESYSGTLFESNPRDVYDGIARAKRLIEKDPRHVLNYNKFRSLIGLEDAPCGVCVGWHRTRVPFNPVTKIVPIDGKEVIGIFYNIDGEDPSSDYYTKNIY